MASTFSIEQSKDEAEMMNQLGNGAFEKKRFAEAIKFYTTATELEPKVAKYWSNRSLAHKNNGDFADAMHDGYVAMNLAPSNFKFHSRVVTALKCMEEWEMFHYMVWVAREKWKEAAAEYPEKSFCTAEQASRLLVPGPLQYKKCHASAARVGKFPLQELPTVEKLDPSSWFLFSRSLNDRFPWQQCFVRSTENCLMPSAVQLERTRFLVDAFMLPYLDDSPDSRECTMGRFVAFVMVAHRVGMLFPDMLLNTVLQYLAESLVVKNRTLADVKAFWKVTPYWGPGLMPNMVQLQRLVATVPLMAWEESAVKILETGFEDFQKLPSCIDFSFVTSISNGDLAVGILTAMDARYRELQTDAEVEQLFTVTSGVIKAFVLRGADSWLDLAALGQYIKFRKPMHAWIWHRKCLQQLTIDSFLNRWYIALSRVGLATNVLVCTSVHEYYADCLQWIEDPTQDPPKAVGTHYSRMVHEALRVGSNTGAKLIDLVTAYPHDFGIPLAVLEETAKALTLERDQSQRPTNRK